MSQTDRIRDLKAHQKQKDNKIPIFNICWYIFVCGTRNASFYTINNGSLIQNLKLNIHWKFQTAKELFSRDWFYNDIFWLDSM